MNSDTTIMARSGKSLCKSCIIIIIKGVFDNTICRERYMNVHRLRGYNATQENITKLDSKWWK